MAVGRLIDSEVPQWQLKQEEFFFFSSVLEKIQKMCEAIDQSDEPVCHRWGLKSGIKHQVDVSAPVCSV